MIDFTKFFAITRHIQSLSLCALLCLAIGIRADKHVYAQAATIESVTSGAKKIEGLFNLHFDEKKQKLFMEINRSQMEKDIILPISIARGAGVDYLGGDTLNFGNQWLIQFKRVANKVHVIRRNIKFTAKKNTPLADAVKTSYTDSVILALSIQAEDAARGVVLIDAAKLFMIDLAGIGITPDTSRSTWAKVKGFSGNVEIEVAAVFNNRSSGGFRFRAAVDDRSIPDNRGAQVVIHYGLSMLPKSGYSPRTADDRLGYFLTSINDFSKDVSESPKVRYINRWHLEKSDSKAKLSPPKKPIIFWIEKSIPFEYRAAVREGVLEWNKAFEKIGFLEAIQCRDQLSLDDFDPEDIRFNTIRWITTSAGFAMGPSRTNPLTGEILDADIVFDEGMIRAYRNRYVRTLGIPKGLELLLNGEKQLFYKTNASAIPEYVTSKSQIQEYLALRTPQTLNQGQNQSSAMYSRTMLGNCPLSCNSCAMGQGMQRQVGLIEASLIAQGMIAPGEKIPTEYINQVIKEVVMHEVGHTLGLRHNFKASTVLSLDEIRNPAITAKKGTTGSIMDYTPAYFAPKGKKQGDYFSKTIGPYDYWVIEYAYSQFASGEEAALKKIASKASAPELTFATDEDLSPESRSTDQSVRSGRPFGFCQRENPVRKR